VTVNPSNGAGAGYKPAPMCDAVGYQSWGLGSETLEISAGELWFAPSHTKVALLRLNTDFATNTNKYTTNHLNYIIKQQ
jgi:hypothetical protein